MSSGKIIVEVILAIISLVIGNVFWSCVKSTGFLGSTLKNENELKRHISFYGANKIIQSSTELGPPPKEYTQEQLIFALFFSCIKSYDKGRDSTGILFLFVCIGSFFLSGYFVIINLFCFIIMGFGNISSSAKNNVSHNIHSLMLIVYRWHLLEPDQCKIFCLNDKQRISVLYTTLISEMEEDKS